jgi:hypothetical protein
MFTIEAEAAKWKLFTQFSANSFFLFTISTLFLILISRILSRQAKTPKRKIRKLNIPCFFNDNKGGHHPQILKLLT